MREYLKDKYTVVLKYILSFRRSEWEFEDYPIMLKRQRSKTPPPVPTWQLVPWVARVINMPQIQGHGETREEAYTSLQVSFRRYKERGGKLPRPSTKLARWRWVPPWEKRKQREEAARQRQRIWLEKQRIKAEFGLLYYEVLGILAYHDPLRLISSGAPDDEYAVEVRAILPRLKEASSVDDLQRIVLEVFVRYFGNSARTGDSKYPQIARDVWDAWKRH